MYKLFPLFLSLFFYICSFAQINPPAGNSQTLQIGFSSGIYQENNNISGLNAMLNFDYEINSKWVLSQSNQFAFLKQEVPYVNSHLSILLFKQTAIGSKFKFLYGAGLAYTKYNKLETIHFGSDIQGTRTNVHTYYAMTFPVQAEINYGISKDLAIGVRGGTHFGSQGSTANFSFVNPVIKYKF